MWLKIPSWILTALNKLLARVLNACFSFLNKTNEFTKAFYWLVVSFLPLHSFPCKRYFFIYLQGKGLSNSEIAFSLSLLFFCNQALAILAGIWGDRFGLAKMMLLGCFLDVIAYIFFLSADNYILLLIATTCFGLGSCLFGTNAKACLLVLAGEEYKEKTRLQGKYLKVTSMSSMFAPFVSDSIYQIQSHWMVDLGLLCDGSDSLCPNG